MSESLWAHLLAGVRADGVAALVHVAAIRGSTPREAGAWMGVLKDGRFTGTIGGGALEYEAQARAVAMMHSADHGLATDTLPLGPRLGQCCGGAVDLVIEVFGAARLDELEALARAEADGPFQTAGMLQADRVVRRVLAPGETSLADQQLDTYGRTRVPLYLFGAGHVARALMLSLAPLDFEVTWIDNRDDAFPSIMPENFTALHHADPASLVAGAPSGALVLVMTHDHGLDLAIMAAALQRHDFRYTGVIGSDTKRKRFESQLLKRGFGDDQISRMVCPIGIRGLNSKRPEVIAVGVAAELLGVILG